MPDLQLEPLSPETARAAAAALSSAADALNTYRFDHVAQMTEAQFYALEGHALHLYQLAGTLYARATLLTVAHAATATREIEDATASLTRVVQQIASVHQAITVAAALVGFASAIAVGNFEGIVAAAAAIQRAASGTTTS